MENPTYTHYPVAYAAPMPEEEKSAIYKNQLELLIKVIHDMKGITKEVSN